MVEYFKKNATIWDPETGEYQKIETVKRLKIHGVDRVFYDLGTGVGTSPESRWREHHQVMIRQPRSEDFDV